MQYKTNKHSVETYEREVVCDICKKQIEVGNFERANVELKAEIGESYPEATFATTAELDCCVSCFTEKVRPLIERELNVKFTEYDSETGREYQEFVDGVYDGRHLVDNIHPTGRCTCWNEYRCAWCKQYKPVEDEKQDQELISQTQVEKREELGSIVGRNRCVYVFCPGVLRPPDQPIYSGRCLLGNGHTPPCKFPLLTK